jgi:hypothetical protein
MNCARVLIWAVRGRNSLRPYTAVPCPEEIVNVYSATPSRLVSETEHKEELS